jgi:anti-sigma factor RsiW
MSADHPPPPSKPVTEAELHAFVDGQLAEGRQREVEAFLASHTEEAMRVEAYRAQKRALRSLFDTVLDEQPPQRLVRAARLNTAPRVPWYLQRLAAGLLIATISGATGYALHGARPAPKGDEFSPLAAAVPASNDLSRVSATSFAERAAIAHAVYSTDVRRPVEVDAAHEDQLVAWLSKRMGAPMKPPHLLAQGYTLEGGRLLPGGQGPVAQFMYRNQLGSKLTLYVSNGVADLGSAAGSDAARGQNQTNTATAFRFAREGAVNVFYWVDGPFGYALSADADRAVLARVSAEVYAQLGTAH